MMTSLVLTLVVVVVVVVGGVEGEEGMKTDHRK